MSQKLEQTQGAALAQQTLPLRMALLGLIELPVADFEERVQNEMLENSALEERDRDEAPEAADGPEGDPGEHERQETETEVEMADYFSADEIPDYLQARADAADARFEPVQAGAVSFYESLQQQMGEHDLSEHERRLMDYLIGSLDGDGFLRKDPETLCDELAVYHNVMTTADELARLLEVLHTFEPRGIGARDLKECLRLQLTDPDNFTPVRKRALQVVDRCFKDFVGKRWDNIMERLGMEREEFDRVIRELTHLNPVPGRALSESDEAGAPTIVPDFYVSVNADGSAAVSLNNGSVPELRVSRAFRETIAEYAGQQKRLTREQHEAYLYAKQKVDAAQIFIGLLERRHRALMSVMTAIVELQRPFFDEDDELLLRPLMVKDVAERVGISSSTVSRVVGSKYVQTDYGVYPLKFFFSAQYASETGDDIPIRRIKNALREIIAAEDKSAPIADEALAAALKEAGFSVARRTVTKYREQLGIPVARLRKE